MAERHKLGGRTFVVVRESTVEQDYTFLAMIRDAGVAELTMDPEEEPEGFARRILEAVIRSGAVLKLLGCLLVPEELVPKRSRFTIGRRPEPGEMWTPEIAGETAEFLGRLHDPADKTKVQALVLSLLLSFFESGIVSLWTMGTSSDETIPEKELESPEESPTTTRDRSPRSVSAVGPG